MSELEHAAVLQAHRSFYDAIETGDLDLMGALWLESPSTVCVHPHAAPLRGTDAILRSWAVLMANIEYVQFFLTDVSVSVRPDGEGEVAVVTCTESILSDVGGEASADPTSFAGSSAVATSVLVHGRRGWKLWSRHASPVADLGDDA